MGTRAHTVCYFPVAMIVVYCECIARFQISFYNSWCSHSELLDRWPRPIDGGGGGGEPGKVGEPADHSRSQLRRLAADHQLQSLVPRRRKLESCAGCRGVSGSRSAPTGPAT